MVLGMSVKCGRLAKYISCCLKEYGMFYVLCAYLGLEVLIFEKNCENADLTFYTGLKSECITAKTIYFYFCSF